jgi:Mlc titration factor MtfA (ptsG expression regulator)
MQFPARQCCLEGKGFLRNKLLLPMKSGILFFIIILIVAVISLAQYLRSKAKARKIRDLYDHKRKTYDELLQQYIPYYRALDPTLKERFLRRTLIFMASKKFKYVEMEGEEYMPVLVSAAVVQLTFGLRHYLLDHFDTIYIVKRDYHFGLFNVPFQGHVNDDGIYLSWNNFLRGFENYSDGDNVGLHEMAHALAYVNFTSNDGIDEGFKQRFWRFSAVGRTVFKRLQAGEINMLGSYAATNYQEFWAVCVENFFERSVAFKIQLPELYEVMCNLLNQDMLKPGLLLKPVVEEGYDE